MNDIKINKEGSTPTQVALRERPSFNLGNVQRNQFIPNQPNWSRFADKSKNANMTQIACSHCKARSPLGKYKDAKGLEIWFCRNCADTLGLWKQKQLGRV